MMDYLDRHGIAQINCYECVRCILNRSVSLVLSFILFYKKNMIDNKDKLRQERQQRQRQVGQERQVRQERQVWTRKTKKTRRTKKTKRQGRL